MSRCPPRSVVFCLAGLLAACAEAPTASIPPGYTAADSAKGVIVLHVERLDLKRHLQIGSTLQTIDLWREESDQKFECAAAADGETADFYLELPAGHYLLLDPLVPYPNVVRMTVAPGAIRYVGMLRVREGAISGLYSDLFDDFDLARTRFGASHPELAERLEKSLFELLLCGGGRACVDVPWQGPAHVLR